MKLFLKIVFGNLVALAIVGVLLFFALSTLIGLLMVIDQRAAPAPHEGVLALDLSINVTDAPPGTRLMEVIERSLGSPTSRSESLLTLQRTLEHAASDDNIVALYLSGNFMPAGYGSGFSTLRELRQSIKAFRETGKPVIAYLNNPTIREIYVASAADQIHVNPHGIIAFNGLASTQFFLAGLLEKYGIGVQTVRAGRYKTATNIFSETRMTDDDREQTQALLNTIWEEILESVGNSRDMTPQQLQRIADEIGLLRPSQAIEAGMIDYISHFDEVIETLTEIAGTPGQWMVIPQIDFFTYAERIREESMKMRAPADVIAVVYIEGDLIDGEGIGGIVGADTIARRIRSFRQSDEVRALVVRVNSPGGSASAAETIQREIALARERMPVVVSLGSFAASGGYWVAVESDRIFAQPNTITGSIGVFGMLPNIQEIANRHGVTFDTARTSRLADVFSIARPKTELEMELVQEHVDQIYEEFIERVARGRNITIEQSRDLAQGRIWSGLDARRIGLVDEIGGLREAIDHAAERAGLTQWRIEEFPRGMDFAEALAETLGREQPMPIIGNPPHGQLIRDLIAEYQWLRAFNDPRGIYMRMPFVLRIH